MKVKKLLARTATFLLLFCLVASTIPPASAAKIPSVSSSKYYSCYTIKSSGRVYAYTTSSLSAKTGGYISASSDECRILGFSGKAVRVSYPVSNGRRIAWFPRSAFSPFRFTSNGYRRASAKQKITTYRRYSGGPTYASISKGDTVTILGSKGSRTQVIYPVGNHYKLAWINGTQSTQSGATISAGTYTIATALNRNLVLDVSSNATHNGANIQIWSANQSTAQQFRISRVTGQWYKIIHTRSGKAIDVENGNSASQTNVQLYEYNGTAAQLWRFIPYSGGYLIQNKLGKYLDVSGGNGTSGANVWVYNCNRSSAQIWYLSSVSSASQQISAKLNEMINGNFKNGVYKKGTTYRGPYASEQCKGFARAITQDLFGYTIGSTKSRPYNYLINTTSNTRQVGTVSSISNDSQLKSLLTQGRPGDFIQLRRRHGGSHSMILLSASSSGISVFECNLDGKNSITTSYYSWANLRSKNAAIGLYTATDYTLHC